MPIIYIVTLLVFVIGLAFKQSVAILLYPVAFLYAMMLLYCSYLIVREYFKIRSIQVGGDRSYDNLLKWTQWSIFLMSGTGLGFPFIIFVSNVTARSLYGILTIAVSFICILGILGYTLSYNVIKSIEEKRTLDYPSSSSEHDEDIGTEDTNISDSDANAISETVQNLNSRNVGVIDAARLAKITTASDLFIAQRKFTVSGLTIKDAAKEMDVPVYLLKTWLRTTEYSKFNNWIICLRINYAKELLTSDPALSNDVVAEKCGFCDRQYFQSQFSKLVGVTPHKWVQGR